MEISLVMLLLMVKGKMRVTLPTTPTSPLVSHTDSHIVSTTYSIVTPSMTLASPNNDSLNDFDESKKVPVRTLWWDFLSSKNWHNNYHGIYYGIGTIKQSAINYYCIAMNFDSIYLLYYTKQWLVLLNVLDSILNLFGYHG